MTLYRDHGDDLSEVQNDSTLPVDLKGAAAYGAQIYQASGMVAVQLAIEVTYPLVCVRAYAFGHERTVSAVAADMVARRVRLTDDTCRETEG